MLHAARAVLEPVRGTCTVDVFTGAAHTFAPLLLEGVHRLPGLRGKPGPVENPVLSSKRAAFIDDLRPCAVRAGLVGTPGRAVGPSG